MYLVSLLFIRFLIFFWLRIKCFLVMIHLLVLWLSSKLETLYRILLKVNECKIHFQNRSRWKSGRSLLSSIAEQINDTFPAGLWAAARSKQTYSPCWSLDHSVWRAKTVQGNRIQCSEWNDTKIIPTFGKAQGRPLCGCMRVLIECLRIK